jgi:hypothetical protein
MAFIVEKQLPNNYTIVEKQLYLDTQEKKDENCIYAPRLWNSFFSKLLNHNPTSYLSYKLSRLIYLIKVNLKIRVFNVFFFKKINLDFNQISS